MAVAIVTDSNAQLPDDLRNRYRMRVVPITVLVDGVPHLEGVDLDPVDFYERLSGGASVSTAAPSPGQVLEAYEAAARDGATAVLSIHVGSDVSATVQAAQVAAGMSPIPVTVIDTSTASFAVACCAWAAGEALAAGADLDAAAAEARRVAGAVGNVFVLGARALAEAGGRLAPGAADSEKLSVLALEGGQMRAVGQARSIDEALDAMVAYVAAADGGRQRVGVGDALAPELGADLADRLRQVDLVEEVVRYAVGPSVGAHTGAGTIGAVFYPVAP